MRKFICIIMVLILLLCGCAQQNSEPENSSVNGCAQNENSLVSDDNGNDSESEPIYQYKDTTRLILFKDINNPHIYDILEKGFIDAADEMRVKYSVNTYEISDYIKNEGFVFTDPDTELDLMEILAENNNSFTGVYCHWFTDSRYEAFFEESEIMCAQNGAEGEEFSFCDLLVNTCSEESIYKTAAEHIKSISSDSSAIGFAARVGYNPKEQSTDNKLISELLIDLDHNGYNGFSPLLWDMSTGTDKIISDLKDYINKNSIAILVANNWIPVDVLDEIKKEFPDLTIIYLTVQQNGIIAVSNGIVDAAIGTDYYELGYAVASEMANIINGKSNATEINMEVSVVSGENRLRNI